MQKKIEKPVLLHVVTQKGRGYTPAENRPDKFHGIAPFYVEEAGDVLDTGKLASEHLIARAISDARISVITAAMPSGTGMATFQRAYPDRFFDVGIAEEHAVTMAAGMALTGMKPFVCIYSTFLQRAYDQIMMDVCMNQANVTFLLDRAGLNGADGETHQGVFDLSYLRQMPNLMVCTPRDAADLRRMLDMSLHTEGPVAIRYSKDCLEGEGGRGKMLPGKWELLRKGNDIVIFAAGRMVRIGLDAAAILEKQGISCAVADARFIKPLDEEMLLSFARKGQMVVTLEDNVLSGGLGGAVMEMLSAADATIKVVSMGVPDEFIPQGSVSQQLAMLGLTAEDVAKKLALRWKKK